jgi:hypothetical protein
LSFDPAPAGDIASALDEKHLKYVRKDYKGANPSFLATDWTIGYIAPTVFYDGFDYGAYNSLKWIAGASNTPSVVMAPPGGVGSHSLRLVGGNGTPFGGVHALVPALKPKIVKVRIRVSSTTVSTGYIVLSESAANTSFSKTSMYLAFGGGGIFLNGKGLIPSYTTNVFHAWEFRLNWKSKTMSVYLNGKLQASNVEFYNTGQKSVGRIDLFNHGNSISWYDHLEMSN